MSQGNIEAVVVCEDTGMIAVDGVCPVHEGDRCLCLPGAYVGEVRRLRAEVAFLEESNDRLGAQVVALLREFAPERLIDPGRKAKQ